MDSSRRFNLINGSFLKQWCNGNQFAYFSIINTDGTLRYAFDNDGACDVTTGNSISNDPVIQINNWATK